jgi:FtsP/CotA-like multicopper oxidase with cupredoxin domain
MSSHGWMTTAATHVVDGRAQWPADGGHGSRRRNAAAPASGIIGLRDGSRRVLTYADLRSTFRDPDGREPGRTVELHLTGHMERFAWSFDGLKFADAEPLRLNYGERMRIVLVNDTMMSHPIHSTACGATWRTRPATSWCASTPSTCRQAQSVATA